MKWDDKSHGKPLEVGLYEGQAIKSEFFLQPIAEGSKTRCVFFSLLLVRLEFSARCSHLMTTKVATCFWLNAHLACALYGFSVYAHMSVCCSQITFCVLSVYVCVSQTWLELREPPAHLLPSVLLIVLAGCPEGISTFSVHSRLNLSIYSLHFTASQVHHQSKYAVWKASPWAVTATGTQCYTFSNVISA